MVKYGTTFPKGERVSLLGIKGTYYYKIKRNVK